MYYKRPDQRDFLMVSRSLETTINSVSQFFRDSVIPQVRETDIKIHNVSDDFNIIALNDWTDANDELKKIISMRSNITDAYGIQRISDDSIMVFVGETGKGNLYDFMFALQTREKISSDDLFAYCETFIQQFLEAEKALNNLPAGPTR